MKTPKPTKVREKIWAVQLDWREPSQHVWSEAFIISRGGADPHRITVRRALKGLASSLRTWKASRSRAPV